MPTATLPQTSAINYERLLGAMPGLYLVLSPELIILEATDAYLHATLTTREQLTGSYIFDAFPNNPAVLEANSVETLQHSFSQVISGKRTHIMPLQRYDIPRPADLGGGFEERYWLATNNPVLDQKGEVLYIIHQVTDVTMQQLAQREVQTNRERFDVLAQATNDIIWDWNLLSNDVWWNRGYQDVLGYNFNELGSETWTTGLHPEDQERVMKGVTGVLEQGGNMWSDKFRYRRADGSYATVISRGFALRDDQGMAYRMIGSMLDVSNLLDNDPGQHDRYKYFPELLNELPDPAWTTDPHGTTTFLNNAWRRVTGMAPGTLKGVGEYIHPEDLVNLNQLWVQYRDLQKTLETEYRIKDQASGQYLWFKARAVPMLNDQGEIEQWFGTCSCIHEQKELQQKLQAREALLQQLMDLSPVHFAVFKGPEHRCEFISPDFKKLHGNRNIVGRTVAEAWPEMVVQGFKNILDSVFASGKPYHGREFPIFTDRYGNGHPQEYFFNFSYYPLTDAQNQVIGLVATATDVTA
ncbi:MAG TPA: PAS domain-containing protein, partial [Adhaeribacter sp.]|nr:PAS domain-containing protein [Adhaeribacter sp.]